MLKILLVVFVMINGEWIHGENVDGWGPLEYETLDACLVGARTLNANTPDTVHSYCQVTTIRE